jgi:cyclopropane fatty-acyl-phospholipid synthase-like methyltransferase
MNSDRYDKAYRTDDWFGADHSALLDDYAEHVPEGCRVLDVGVGQGRNAAALARRGCEVLGLDTSPVAVDQVNALAKREGLPLEARLQDFMTFEPDRAFDVVLCFGLMPELDLRGCASLVGRLHHWTRPGGVLFMTAWHTGDPSFAVCQEEWQRRSSRTFRHPEDGRSRLFLEPGELLKLFFRWGVVHHREGLGPEHRHGDGPVERHGIVEAVLTRPRK